MASPPAPVARPLTFRALVQDDHALCAAWMNEPGIAGPLDIRPPVTAADLRRGGLPCYDAYGEARVELVRLALLCDARGAAVGFGISYGWDRADDLIRELDLALRPGPNLPPWVALEGLVRLIDHAFVREGAIEARCRTRVGRVLARLFSALGARPVTRPIQVDAQRRVVERKVLYVVQRAAFYDSSAARACLG